MIAWMSRRTGERAHGDDGIGLVLVLGITTVIMSLVVAASVISVSALKSSGSRVSYENALQTAENGIDFALARVQTAFDEYNLDYPIPNVASTVDASPYCSGSPITAPTFTAEAAERAWARSQLLALAANGACRQSGGSGDWVVLKPQTPLVNGFYPKSGKVYSMGFVPSYDAWSTGSPTAKERLLKAEYVFMPYRPAFAILTGGDVCLNSSTTVTTVPSMPADQAAVHSNGSLCVTNGNPIVTGLVTSTGASTASSNNFTANTNGGDIEQKPRQRVPNISARAFYFKAWNNPDARLTTWYDMCPDGNVRPQSANGPCTSSVSLNNGVLPFNGWSFDSTTRIWTAGNTVLDGTYYAHEGSFYASGNNYTAQLTLIAAAKDPDTCATKQYGNIQWKLHSIGSPGYTNTFMFADSDIRTESNFTAGSTSPNVVSGLFVAGDQMLMETSSAGAVGAVVTGDECASHVAPDIVTGPSEIKNPSIYFDPKSESPFTGIVNTTLWLEYNG